MSQGYLKGGWRDKYFITKQIHDENGVMIGIRFTEPNAKYFVMRFDEDPHARVAMYAYAASVQLDNPEFDKDIRKQLLATHDSPGAFLNVVPFPPRPLEIYKPWMFGDNEEGTVTIWEAQEDADADDGWIAGEVVTVVDTVEEARRIIGFHGSTTPLF